MARRKIQSHCGGIVVMRNPLAKRRFLPVALAASMGATAVLGTGCGLDAALFHRFTGNDTEAVPGAGRSFIAGRASILSAGATVTFRTASGAPLSDLDTATQPDGLFIASVSATVEFANMVVAVTQGGQQYWGLVPSVPRKQSVLEPDPTIVMGSTTPVMADLGPESTLATLVLLARSRYAVPPLALSALSPTAAADIVNELDNLLEDEDPRVTPLRDMVQRILGPGAAISPPLLPFPSASQSYLNLSALSPGFDYTGDGAPDTDTAAFDAALEQAVNAQEVDTCFPKDRIRVVMMVDFNPGKLDANCASINRFKWTKDDPGRRMFITGGIHPTTPNCDTDAPPCLTAAEFDAGSDLLGRWTPNKTPMFDDGTNADAVAGDNIWTLALDLPWFDAGAPENRWVRIHYKYTWGNPGQLWTSTEEWPGNSRILELRDITGDRIITRYDNYGDETTNKDNANGLSPGKGGCGKVLWASESPPETCKNDTLENMIDTDGDCIVDTWPTPGTAGPITIDCGE
jgi:hypothetical protein